MADLERYAVESNGEYVFVCDDIDEARSVAIDRKATLVALLYSLDDSELIEDYSKEDYNEPDVVSSIDKDGNYKDDYWK